MCLHERFEVRLRALTELTKALCLGNSALVMGGHTYILVGGLSGVRAQTGSFAKLKCATIIRRLDKTATSGTGGGRGAGCTPSLHHIIHWHLPYNLGKSRKTSDRASEKRSAYQRRARFVDLAIVERWPPSPIAFASGDGVNPRSA
jgi:hypothetical protein